jgi:stage V sporulation protein G
VQITEVRIKLMEEDSGERLKAFCSITFDDAFVVRDLKIIEGTNGPFVAMPSRKLTSHCGNCGSKNHLRALHCNQCGRRLPENRVVKDDDGRARLYADIAHPINSECREMIQQRVVSEFREELIRAKQEGYVSRYDEYDYDGGEFDDAAPSPPRESRPMRTGDRIHVHEGPQRTPAGPHTAPSNQPAMQPASQPAAQPAMNPAPPPPMRQNHGETAANNFGAGIFE